MMFCSWLSPLDRERSGEHFERPVPGIALDHAIEVEPRRAPGAPHGEQLVVRHGPPGSRELAVPFCWRFLPGFEPGSTVLQTTPSQMERNQGHRGICSRRALDL